MIILIRFWSLMIIQLKDIKRVYTQLVVTVLLTTYSHQPLPNRVFIPNRPD